jgi:hypothetical protein
MANTKDPKGSSSGMRTDRDRDMTQQSGTGQHSTQGNPGNRNKDMNEEQQRNRGNQPGSGSQHSGSGGSKQSGTSQQSGSGGQRSGSGGSKQSGGSQQSEPGGQHAGTGGYSGGEISSDTNR